MMQPEHTPLIEFKSVSKHYDNHTAVNEPSLTIYQGEFFVSVGGSGSGRSTTLCMTDTLTEPTDGDVYFNGRRTKGYDIRRLRHRIGYVLQQIALFPTMTVRQNTELMPDILGWDKPKRVPRVNELLKLVGMPPETYPNHYPHELPGGEQQRIGILYAIAARPDILLIDELFSAFDPLAHASLQEMVSLIHKKLGTTIVLITYDMSETAKLACRIGMMRQDRPVQVDIPQDIQNYPTGDYARSLFGTTQPENITSADEVINLYRRLDTDSKTRVREYWVQDRMDV